MFEPSVPCLMMPLAGFLVGPFIDDHFVKGLPKYRNKIQPILGKISLILSAKHSNLGPLEYPLEYTLVELYLVLLNLINIT